MKKILNSMFLFLLFFVLSGCAPDLEKVEEAIQDNLYDSKLGFHIEDIKYVAGGKDGGFIPIHIEIKVDKEFADLTNKEKYEILLSLMPELHKETISIIDEIPCGDNNECQYGELRLSYDQNTYIMQIEDSSSEFNSPDLIINDSEEYTAYDFRNDNKEHEVETEPTQSVKQTQPRGSYDPKKDSANYDKYGNYKPVDEMTPEEIKAELEGFLEDAIENDQQGY